jgi:hypothetical protein
MRTLRILFRAALGAESRVCHPGNTTGRQTTRSAHVQPPLAVNSKSERKVNSLPPLGFQPVIFEMLMHLSNHSAKFHPPWNFMKFNEKSHGISWKKFRQMFMEFHETSWNFMKNVMKFHETLSNFMKACTCNSINLWWNFMKFHEISSLHEKSCKSVLTGVIIKLCQSVKMTVSYNCYINCHSCVTIISR